MNDREKFAYFAGIIDGEGTVSIEKSSKNRKVPYYYARLTITNTNMDMLNWITTNFGGKLFPKKQFTSLGTQKCFYWHAFGDRMENFLTSTQEFCIIKKEHILNFLEYRKTIGIRGTITPQIKRDARDECYWRSRYLNSLHKKPSALSPVS